MATVKDVANYLTLKILIRCGDVKRQDLTEDLQKLFEKDLLYSEKRKY